MNDSLNNRIYSVNFNGIVYPECTFIYEELQNRRDGNVSTIQYRCFIRVPENYDGAILGAYNKKIISDPSAYSNVTEKDIIFFRLK